MDFDITDHIIASSVSSSLSIIGSIIVIVALLVLWRRVPPGYLLYDRIVFLLALSDGINGIINITHAVFLVDKDIPGALCSVLATVKHTYELYAVFLETLFGFELAWHVRYTMKSKEGSLWYRWRYLVFSVLFLVSLGTAIVPDLGTSFADYEFLTAWCWIGPGYPLARQVLFYMILYICLIINTSLYMYTIYTVATSHIKSHAHTSINSTILKLALFPLVFVVSWMPCILNRIFQAFNHNSVVLDFTVSLLLPLYGFINFILYCVTRDILQKAFGQPEQVADEKMSLLVIN